MQSRSTHATAGTMTTKHAVSFYVLSACHVKAPFPFSSSFQCRCKPSESVPSLYKRHVKAPEFVPMTNDHGKALFRSTSYMITGGACHGATLRVLRPECVPCATAGVRTDDKAPFPFSSSFQCRCKPSESVPWCKAHDRNGWPSYILSQYRRRMTTPGTLECKPSKDIAK